MNKDAAACWSTLRRSIIYASNDENFAEAARTQGIDYKSSKWALLMTGGMI